MEKRFYFGLSLLPLFLILGLLVHFGVGQIQGPITDAFAQAAEAAIEGDLERGISLARQAEQRWQRHRKLVASVVDHNQLDSIDELLGEVEVFAQTQDAEHFAACCARLARLTQALAHGHAPGWENIL